MPYQSAPELSQMLIEAQMKIWDAVALILALSTIVLFILILGSIAWLCLSEMRRARRGRPITRGAQRGNNLVARFAYRDATSVRAHSRTEMLSAQYATRPH